MYSFDHENKCMFRHFLFGTNTCPRFLERITSGDVKVTSDQFPNFLYDEDEAEELLVHDPTDWDVGKGLLTLILVTSLLVGTYFEFSPVICHDHPSSKSFKCIFMGNGFWASTDRKKKSPVSKINGFTQVIQLVFYCLLNICRPCPEE